MPLDNVAIDAERRADVQALNPGSRRQIAVAYRAGSCNQVEQWGRHSSRDSQTCEKHDSGCKTENDCESVAGVRTRVSDEVRW